MLIWLWFVLIMLISFSHKTYKFWKIKKSIIFPYMGLFLLQWKIVFWKFSTPPSNVVPIPQTLSTHCPSPTPEKFREKNWCIALDWMVIPSWMNFMNTTNRTSIFPMSNGPPASARKEMYHIKLWFVIKNFHSYIITWFPCLWLARGGGALVFQGGYHPRKKIHVTSL